MKAVLKLLFISLLFFSCRKGTIRLSSNAEPGSRNDEDVYSAFISDGRKSDAVAVFRSDVQGLPQRGGTQLTGATDSLVRCELRLNGRRFSPQSNGQWSEKSQFLDSLFGKKVMVEFRTGQTAYSQEIYVPLPPAATVDPVGISTIEMGPVIGRKGILLRWHVDPLSEARSVLLRYMVLDKDLKILKSENRFLINNGLFLMDELIQDEKIARIQFTLISGSSMQITTVRHGRFVIGVGTHDHNDYFVK